MLFIMNHREAKEITQRTETETIRGSKEFSSNVKLHPKMTYGAFVMNYIEELQAEINRLSKENVYLQSDEYLNSIFPTNYIQELKDKIDLLTKDNDLLKKENATKLDPRTTYTGRLDPRTTYAGGLDHKATYAGAVDHKATYGGYSASYVKGLQDELTKLTEENFYFKSNEYQKKISGNYSREKKSMIRKIQRLSLLIQQLSYDSMERESILASLKEILDNRSEGAIRSTQGSFDTE